MLRTAGGVLRVPSNAGESASRACLCDGVAAKCLRMPTMASRAWLIMSPSGGRGPEPLKGMRL